MDATASELNTRLCLPVEGRPLGTVQLTRAGARRARAEEGGGPGAVGAVELDDLHLRGKDMHTDTDTDTDMDMDTDTDTKKVGGQGSRTKANIMLWYRQGHDRPSTPTSPLPPHVPCG